MKKPKIRYKSKKLRLDQILKYKSIDKHFIEQFISNAHQVADHTSHFIRAFIIYLYSNKKDIPKINDDFFKLCSIVLTVRTGGGNTAKGENKKILDSLQDFYTQFYSKLGYKKEDKISSLHLSQMLDYIATEYETSVNNNIINNFIVYLKRYVNAFYITKLNSKISEETNAEFQEFKNIETDYLNLIFPIIEDFINKITFLLKAKYYPQKNYQFKSPQDKKEFKFLEKCKQKYVGKYKNICKKLKIKPNFTITLNYNNLSIDSIKMDLNLIDEINNSFIESTKEIKLKNNHKRKNRNDELKALKAELFKVKNDIVENTNNADPKYYAFIKNIRDNILPVYDSSNFTLLEYIKENPQKFIKSMMIMVDLLEKNNYKLFQFLPLYSSLIQRSVKIDTKILIEIFIEENKKEYLDNVRKYQNEIWDNLFRFNTPAFRLSKSSPYVFDYSIVTNGYTASIIFMHKDDKNKKTNVQNLGQEKRKSNKKLLEDLNNDEKIAFKKKQEDKNETDKLRKAVENNKKQKENKENFKKLSKEEQNKIKEENKRKNQDFLYIDELNDEELKKIKKKSFQNKIITNDPGKKNLLFMQDAKGNTLRYSNKEHLKRTRRLEYAEKLNKLKDELEITKREQKLSNYSSKTINFSKFCKYIKKRNETKNKIKDKYANIKFRQYKWYSYINNERAQTTLINNIKKKFGEDIIIFYGDWSIGKQMANFISTPNLTLKRKIAEYFKVYNLDEYNTSKLSNETFEACENLVLKDKFGVPRELHSVLTYTKENKINECKLGKPLKCNVNRDNNSSKNMMFIVRHYIKHKRFPKEFMRNGNEELQLDIIEKIYNILEKLKDKNISNLKIKELENIINERDLGEMLYLVKNAVSSRKTLVPDGVKSNDKIKEIVNKIFRELKNDKEKLISKYKNKEKLKVLFKEQRETKKPVEPKEVKLLGSRRVNYMRKSKISKMKL
jgi:hypothetical protein